MNDTRNNLDPYDLQLSCQCGKALRPYECYEPEHGPFLTYAATDHDALALNHKHDVAIITIGVLQWDLNVYGGNCSADKA